MSQRTYIVGTEVNGSIWAVVGSGIISMSDSLIAWNPRIEEPSNPTPSVKMSSSTSAMLLEVCCQVPRRSTKRKSTILTPASLAIFMTSDGVFAMCALSSTLYPNTPVTAGPCNGVQQHATSGPVPVEAMTYVVSPSIPEQQRYVSCSLPVIVQPAGEHWL